MVYLNRWPIVALVLMFWFMQVTVPCYVLQSCKDLAVPVVVSDYLFHSLGGPTKVEILQTEGHLPQLSSPELLIPVMKHAIMDQVSLQVASKLKNRLMPKLTLLPSVLFHNLVHSTAICVSKGHSRVCTSWARPLHSFAGLTQDMELGGSQNCSEIQDSRLLGLIHKPMVKSSVNEENSKKAIVTVMTAETGKRMMISGEQ